MTDEEKRKRLNKQINDWKKENRERINMLFPKGTKEKIKAVADPAGLSISEFVTLAINEKLEKDKKILK